MIVVIVKNFLRRIFESILYILVSGCQWRMLPKDFPKWKTVYRHFSGWNKDVVLNSVLIRLSWR